MNKYKRIFFLLILFAILLILIACDDTNDTPIVDPGGSTEDEVQSGIYVDPDPELVSAVEEYLLSITQEQEPTPITVGEAIDRVRDGHALIQMAIDASNHFFLAEYCDGMEDGTDCTDHLWVGFTAAEYIEETHEDRKCHRVFQVNRASIYNNAMTDEKINGNAASFATFTPEFKDGKNITEPIEQAEEWLFVQEKAPTNLYFSPEHPLHGEYTLKCKTSYGKFNVLQLHSVVNDDGLFQIDLKTEYGKYYYRIKSAVYNYRNKWVGEELNDEKNTSISYERIELWVIVDAVNSTPFDNPFDDPGIITEIDVNTDFDITAENIYPRGYAYSVPLNLVLKDGQLSEISSDESLLIGEFKRIENPLTYINTSKNDNISSDDYLLHEYLDALFEAMMDSEWCYAAISDGFFDQKTSGYRDPNLRGYLFFRFDDRIFTVLLEPSGTSTSSIWCTEIE